MLLPLRVRERLINRTPSWRLIQELKNRGDLVVAPGDDAGYVRHWHVGRETSDGEYACDRFGLPLWRIQVEDCG